MQQRQSLSEFTQLVKDQASLDLIVREYVPDLIQRGSSWKACCPFHGEKTPSFHVHPEKGFYHCFGCGVSGDVIKFVQEIEKVDFMMALEILARKLGLEMPRFERSADPEGDKRRLAQLRELCTWASEFFVKQLDASPRGKLARQYLHTRELNDDLIRDYGLGYAPPSYEALLAAAHQAGYSAELVAEAGLALRRDDGSFSDRFYDRAIFPIADAFGQVVAFGGRIIEKDAHPAKYINTAETALFKKGRLLYGLNMAREAIKDGGEAILLEGYMDWLALHARGIGNVLAGMGTALTEGQARLIKRQCPRVTLLYDGDEAGNKAMFRSSEILLREGLDVRVATLPEGLDPDDFIKAEGVAAMRERLDEPMRTIDYFSRRLASEMESSAPEAKSKMVQDIAPLLRAIDDPVLREGYIQQVAGRLAIRPETLESALRHRSHGQRRGSQANTQPSPFGQPEFPEDLPEEELSSAAPAGSPPVTEQNMLYFLLNHWEEGEWLTHIEAEWFEHEITRTLFERLVEMTRDVREGADPPSTLIEIGHNDWEQSWLSRLLLLPEQRFGGALEPDSSSDHDAFELQCMKLKKAWSSRRKRMMLQQLQMNMDESGQSLSALNHLGELSRRSLNEHQEYLKKRKD